MKSNSHSQKLRGGYYTPEPIAQFVSRWAILNNKCHVLEPSCGDGAFLVSTGQVLLEKGASTSEIRKLVLGVEFDLIEAEKARSRSHATVLSGDFFTSCRRFQQENMKFDAVVGNPPFIRYQTFSEKHRKIAFQLMAEAGLHPTRLTNAWVPFLIASTQLLSENGRLGMVIPAELFQVNYTAETRLFLTNFFRQITIITFKKLVFEGIQQEVVLLLADRSSESGEGVRVFEVNSADDLLGIDIPELSKSELKPMDHSTEKWTQYYLNTKEITLLRKLKGDRRIPLSVDAIDVDVGVVTGENEFFVLKDEEVSAHGLERHVQPLVGRSNQLKGAIFTKLDLKNNRAAGCAAQILMVPNLEKKVLSKSLRKYIILGEKRAFNTGYKCRIRKHWYAVPSVWVPHAFMLRQVHGYPKLVLNNSGATCTDTVHRVKFIQPKLAKTVTAAFMNSMTFAFSEVTGRSYGGGVLTFEPSEAEALPLPLTGAETLDLEEIDQVLRTRGIDAVLDITDQRLLIEGLGMRKSEVRALRTIWEKLRDRRTNRNHFKKEVSVVKDIQKKITAKKPTKAPNSRKKFPNHDQLQPGL